MPSTNTPKLVTFANKILVARLRQIANDLEKLADEMQKMGIRQTTSEWAQGFCEGRANGLRDAARTFRIALDSNEERTKTDSPADRSRSDHEGQDKATTLKGDTE